MTKRRVLITGSAGFLGRHIIDHLLVNTDWNLIGLDSFRHRGDSLRVQPNDRYQIHCCDLAAPISYRLREKIGPIDFIINSASESHVDRSIADPVPFVQNNVNLALNMLEFARKQDGLTKFIQVSTDETYGPALEGTDHPEWSTILPSNPYAASKAAQEAIAISYWRTFSIPLMITNTMNLQGEFQDPEKYLPLLIQKISKEQTVSVHGNPQYIGKRHYLHARNMADALLFLLKEIHPERYGDGSDRPSRFNIVGDVELDNLQLAQKVAGIMGKQLHYELQDFHSQRPGHDLRYALCGSKMRTLGWRAPVDYDSSLKKTIAWYLENPEWLK